MTVDHPVWGTMCEICFCAVTPENCTIDEQGVKWDVHAGFCAAQAGIKELEPITTSIHICEYDTQ